MSVGSTVLLVTIDDGSNIYEDALSAIKTLESGSRIQNPPTIRFPNESLLSEVFNERTYTLLRVIRDDTPSSIRETARLVGRDKKNVHEELTTLESLGVIRFEDHGRSKQPIFPYDDLIVAPLSDRFASDATGTS